MQDARNGSFAQSGRLGVVISALCAAALLASAPAQAVRPHHRHVHHHHALAASDTATVRLASYEIPAADAALTGGDATDTANDADEVDVASAAPGDIMQTGTASWYGRAWKGRRTSSGTRFDPEAMTAASHVLPLGTRVLVTLEGTARSVLVTITDRQGCASRVIDLSMAAARQIGMLGMGTARVVLRRA